MNLGDIVEDFEADTTLGKIKLHDYLGTSWVSCFIGRSKIENTPAKLNKT